MGEGIRIEVAPESGLPRHQALMLVVRDHDRPTPPPLDGTPLERALAACVWCERAGVAPTRHFVKTYHLALDADGTQVVSPGVWEGLRRCAQNPMRVVNAVTAPPPVHLSLTPPSLVAPGVN